MIHEQIIRVLRDPDQELATDSRNTSLRSFRDYVGANVYLGRIPDGVMANYACVIKPIAVERDYSLAGERDVVSSSLQIDVYANGWDGSTRAIELHEYIRLALSSYIGTLDDVEVYNAYISRESLDVSSIIGSENWEFRYSVDWTFQYAQEVIASNA